MVIKELFNRLMKIQSFFPLRKKTELIENNKEFENNPESANLPNKKNLRDKLQTVLMVVSLCVFLFSLFMIGKRLYGYYHDYTQLQQIQDEVNSDNMSEIFTNPLPTQNPSAGEPTIPYVTLVGDPNDTNASVFFSKYTQLKQKNTEMISWIQMPGFKKPIDYPVMQTKDNEFYLKHDFYMNESYAGSIFMDSRNNPNEVDPHIIIYGHAMLDRSMFGNLKEFAKKPNDYTKNTKIRLYLENVHSFLEYEVFSTYFEKETFNYRQTKFNSDKEFKDFLTRIQSKSVHDFGVKLTSMDKIITLSTCNNSMGNDVRSITHARLVRQIIYNPSDKEPANGNEPVGEIDVVSANVYLKQLTLQYGAAVTLTELKLTPAFQVNLREFTAALPTEVEKISLTTIAADPEAKVQIFLNEKTADPSNLPMVIGANIIKIKITARDGKFSRTLVVTVTRGPMGTPTVSPTPDPKKPKTSPSVSPTGTPKASSTPSSSAGTTAKPGTTPTPGATSSASPSSSVTPSPTPVSGVSSTPSATPDPNASVTPGPTLTPGTDPKPTATPRGAPIQHHDPNP